MRVLFVTHAFPPTIGGVESHVADVSRLLSDAGHQVHCFVGGQPSEESVGDVTVTRTPDLTVPNLLNHRARLPADAVDGRYVERIGDKLAVQVERFRPDVIHMHNAHHFAPEPAIACISTGVPAINSVHDRVGEHVYPQVLRYEWQHTLFASQYLRKALPTPHGRASVLRLGIDTELFAPHGPQHAFVVSLPRPVILHPARLLRWKGPDVSVRAFARLYPELGGSLVLSASTTVADDVSEVRAIKQELQEFALQAGIADRVFFVDFPYGRMPEAYRAADIVWYPTTDEEPYGLVPLEAMACGRPVVVSASGGMRETVRDGVTGAVVPKGDPDALAAATRKMVREPSYRAMIVSAALATSKQFDIREYAQRLESVYGALLAEHRHG